MKHTRKFHRLRLYSRWELLALLLIVIGALLLPHPLPAPESLLAYLRDELQRLRSR